MCFTVIPQHAGDAPMYVPSSSSVPINSNGEELKPAVYYERLKILRQRHGLENNSKVSLCLNIHNLYDGHVFAFIEVFDLRVCHNIAACVLVLPLLV